MDTSDSKYTVIMSNSSGDNGNSGQETFYMDKQNQFGNNNDNEDLFLLLKCHIDSQQRLIQLYRTRIRSFEMFRKYCQRLAHLDDGGGETIKFNLKQFQNEYYKFDLNYRYFRKRIRNLRKQPKSTLSIQNQNVYDILYGLAAKLESNDNIRYLSGDQIYPEVSINVIELAESANNSTVNSGNTQCNNISDIQIYPQISLNNVEEQQPELTTNDSIDPNDPVNNSDENTLDNSDDDVDFFVEYYKQTAKVKSKKLSKSTKTKAATEKVAQTKVKQEISTDSDSVTSVKEKRGKSPNPDIPKVFRCDVDGCHYSITNLGQLNRHKKRRHSDARPFNCDKCELTFKTKSELKLHQNIHEGLRFGCTFEGCTVNYSTKSDISKHIRRFHAKEASLLHCNWDGCDYTTYFALNLRIHQKVHTGERPFKCPDCEMAFKTRAKLWSHKRIHQTEPCFKCDFEGCDYASYSKDLLHSHQYVHNVDRPFKCPDCEMAFKMRAKLLSHKRTHQTERRFKCDFEGCDYASYSKDLFRRHQYVHNVDRQFNCVWSGCGMSFKSPDGLWKHKSIHENQRRYKCNWEGCKYTTCRSQYFKIHLRVHTGERPFKCSDCEKAFISNAHLCRHKRTHQT